MKPGEFRFNNVDSNELSSKIQFRPEIRSPVRKVQIRSVSGADEDYILDEQAYENVPLELSLFAHGENEQAILDAKDLITFTFKGGVYHDFTPYWDPTKIFKVRVDEPPVYRQVGYDPRFIVYSLGLSAKPYKLYSENTITEGTTSVSIDNPSRYASEPLITIFGAGEMNLTVNGVRYPFRNVDNSIVVDSKIESAYKMVSGIPNSRDDRMLTPDFPILKPGTNTLSVSGGATHFTVEPRWRTLVS